MNQETFSRILASICDAETSYDPEFWTQENYLWGHCAVVSLLAQEQFGGDLLRISLAGTEFENAKWHYFNRLPSGQLVDFTINQFQGKLPAGISSHHRTREDVLSTEDSIRRYKLISERFHNYQNKVD